MSEPSPPGGSEGYGGDDDDAADHVFCGAGHQSGTGAAGDAVPVLLAPPHQGRGGEPGSDRGGHPARRVQNGRLYPGQGDAACPGISVHGTRGPGGPL